MFELLEISKQGEFADRIFPIVLADAEIYTPIGQIQYIRYWEKEIEKLEDAIRSVSMTNLQEFNESINLYTEILKAIPWVMDTLADMNALTLEGHQYSGFDELIRAVEDRLNLS